MLDSKIRSIDDLVSKLSNSVSLKHPMLISFVNPYSYFILNDRPDLLVEIESLYIDGALLVKLYNFFNSQKAVARVSFDFSSIAEDVFSHSDENRKSVSLVGGSEFENNLALQKLSFKYPNIDFSFSRNGFFTGHEMDAFISDLARSDVDVVICGMGTPLQEEFLVKLKHCMRDKGVLLFTCGGFITQTAIRFDYYYPIVKKLGLRWLQRFVMHKHVRQRVLKVYPNFVIRYIMYNFRRK